MAWGGEERWEYLTVKTTKVYSHNGHWVLFSVFWRGLEMVAESRFRAANKRLATGGSSIFYEVLVEFELGGRLGCSRLYPIMSK